MPGFADDCTGTRSPCQISTRTVKEVDCIETTQDFELPDGEVHMTLRDQPTCFVTSCNIPFLARPCGFDYYPHLLGNETDSSILAIRGSFALRTRAGSKPQFRVV